MNRVVVTGLGAVTPLGNDVSTTWKGLVNGNSGIGPITAFDASLYDARIAGEVKNFELPQADRKMLRRMDKFVQYALKATCEAVAESRLDLAAVNKDRAGVIIGAGIGGLRVIEQEHTVLLEKGPSRVSPLLIPMLIPDMAAGQVAIQLGFKGPNFATVSACASGAHALAVSLNMLRTGAADVIIAGGTEACITPLGLAGFCSMKALSKRNDEPQKASRPFDAQRNGFVMAEGAGIVVLETLDHAEKRNAPVIHGEFIGAGMSCDAYHMTAPDADGGGAAISVRTALADAGITTADVDYINAHGTSTELNDRAETAAVKKVFGELAYRVPMSSIKSMLGHLLGAAGGVEFVFTMLAIKHGLLPPTINYENRDPDCDLDYVPGKAREKNITIAISNSFGFGGHNITLALKKYIP